MVGYGESMVSSVVCLLCSVQFFQFEERFQIRRPRSCKAWHLHMHTFVKFFSSASFLFALLHTSDVGNWWYCTRKQDGYVSVAVSSKILIKNVGYGPRGSWLCWRGSHLIVQSWQSQVLSIQFFCYVCYNQFASFVSILLA